MQTKSMPRHNEIFNHVAISVPNLEEGIKFYASVFGLRTIWAMDNGGTGELEPDSIMKKIYGPEVGAVKIAMLTSGNGVGIEIFEFIRPKYKGPEKRPELKSEVYTRGGFFHICFTVPDPVEVCAHAEKLGAKQIGITTNPAKGEKAIYMQDPWGNIVELLTCTWEQLFLSGS